MNVHTSQVHIYTYIFHIYKLIFSKKGRVPTSSVEWRVLWQYCLDEIFPKARFSLCVPPPRKSELSLTPIYEYVTAVEICFCIKSFLDFFPGSVLSWIQCTVRCYVCLQDEERCDMTGQHIYSVYTRRDWMVTAHYILLMYYKSSPSDTDVLWCKRCHGGWKAKDCDFVPAIPRGDGLYIPGTYQYVLVYFRTP